jgi:Fur family zinc uptake transcriptional regulator
LPSVGQRRGKRVAANSVYRILDLFVRTNLARRAESANAYVANPHPGCRHDCIFLICDPADKPRTSTMTA